MSTFTEVAFPFMLLLLLVMVPLLAADAVSPLDANGVRLHGKSGEKVLVTSAAFKKGDPLLIVPSQLCLLAHRSGIVRGLGGQTDQLWDEVGDLREPLSDEQITTGRTWDVQLALALLDATAGTGLAGDLWDQYTMELPSPEHMTLPFCCSPEVLDHIQCTAIKLNALKQQMRLKKVSPEVFSDHLSHRVTTASLSRIGDPSAIPTPLQWAFALIRSRCFKVAQDWFAVVPLIDMANHSLMPSARFEISDENPTFDEEKVPGTMFLLRATRDLLEGEEVTICYDQSYSNERLFVQYGFTLPGNPNDDVFENPDITASQGDAANSSVDLEEDQSLGEDVSESLPLSSCEEEIEKAMGLVLRAADRVSAAHHDGSGEGVEGENGVGAGTIKRDDTVESMRVHSASKSILKRLSSNKAQSTGTAATSVAGLLKEVESLSESYATTLEEDKALLATLSLSKDPFVIIQCTKVAASRDHDALSSEDISAGVEDRDAESATASGAVGDSEDVSLNRHQMDACLRRRIERKELLQCAKNILNSALKSALIDVKDVD